MAGNFARSGNTAVLSGEKIQRFDGVQGETLKVLKRITPDGDDLSSTVANVGQDIYSDKYGRIKLRPGCRKISTTGKTEDISSIFMLNIGGLLNYGVIYGGTLDLISIPSEDFPVNPIDFDEDDTKPSDWPSGWPWNPPKDDKPPSDPTDDPAEQTCELHYTIEGSPASMSWTMGYADASGLTSKTWYDKVQGYRPDTELVATYNAGPTWANTGLTASYSWVLGPCEGLTIGGLYILPTGKDADGNWVDPGTYNVPKTLSWSDGTVLNCALTLTIVPPAITLTPTSDSKTVFEGDTGNETIFLDVSNSGAAITTLNWEVSSITGDAELTGIISASPSSGALSGGDGVAVILTLTNPGSLSAGTYNATVTFSDQNLTSLTKDFDVTLNVYPLYTGSLKIYFDEYDLSIPWSRQTNTQSPVASSNATYDPYWHIQYQPSEYLDIGRNKTTGVWYAWIVDDQPTQGLASGFSFRASDGYPMLTFVSHGPEGSGNITRDVTIGPNAW